MSQVFFCVLASIHPIGGAAGGERPLLVSVNSSVQVVPFTPFAEPFALPAPFHRAFDPAKAKAPALRALWRQVPPESALCPSDGAIEV